jgi:hypothetical protein
LIIVIDKIQVMIAMNRIKFWAASGGCGKVFDPVGLGLDDGPNVRADD